MEMKQRRPLTATLSLVALALAIGVASASEDAKLSSDDTSAISNNHTPSSSPGSCTSSEIEGSCSNAPMIPPGVTDAVSKYGVHQWIDFQHTRYEAMEVIEWTKEHMQGNDVRCKNHNPLCTYYAANDECFEVWTIENCAPACKKCHMLVNHLDNRKSIAEALFGTPGSATENDEDEDDEPTSEADDDDEDGDDELPSEDDDEEMAPGDPADAAASMEITPDGETSLNAEEVPVELSVEELEVERARSKMPTKFEYIANDWGEPQQVGANTDERPAVLAQLEKTKEYMQTNGDDILPGCTNERTECAFWASLGECDTNPKYMRGSCAPECQTCAKKSNEQAPAEEQDSDEEDTEEEEKTPLDPSPESFTYVTERIPVEGEGPEDYPDEAQPAGGVYVTNEWGVPQHVGVKDADEVYYQLAVTRRYMVDEVFADEWYDDLKDKCMNKQRECAYWATLGECEREPHYMKSNCSPECQSCHELPYNVRCAFTEKETPQIWKPGDLNRMFERITNDQEFVDKYGPLSILSSPKTTGGPWLITMDNFLSGEECDKFIDIGSDTGYERSHEVGKENFDGSTEDVTNEGRTSTNAWCTDECKKNEITKPVYPRIENMTQIPTDNWELLQLLNYQVGQKYYVHHDFISVEHDRMGGARIITVFMYLNNVEAGGGTRFPRLNLTVTPKRGRVVIWPSVLDGLPSVMDPRTHHEALAVEAGEKYGANAWLHLRNYTYSSERGC